MEEAPPLCTKLPQPILEQINIEQDKINYLLTAKIEEDSITLNISEQNEKDYLFYTRTMKLNEIKDIHKVFYALNSCNDFYDYIKTLKEQNKLSIKKINNNLSINFFVEFLFKKELTEIILFPEKKKLDLIVKDVINELYIIKNKLNYFENNYLKKEKNDLLEQIIKDKIKQQLDNINNKINHLEKENISLKNEIKILKDEIQKLKIEKEENEKLKGEINEIKNLKEEMNKLKELIINKKNDILEEIESSSIIKKNEFEFISQALKSRMKKQIISIKKLYQATVDGGDPKNFHLKCDNISNTLTFIQSKQNRRFGGFTSLYWESSEYDNAKKDKNAFLFSIDKQKIYPIKDLDGKDAIRCKKQWGPCFGRGKDIGIEGNPIKEKRLLTYHSSYNYGGDNNSLSEDEKYDGIYAKDIEVYQIIFG